MIIKLRRAREEYGSLLGLALPKKAFRTKGTLYVKKKGSIVRWNGSRTLTLCKHARLTRHCRECGGRAYCLHGKRKTYCKECGGSAYCMHRKQKHFCRECGGGSMCKHNKEKRYCRECGGNAFCGHDKIKRQCKICDPTK